MSYHSHQSLPAARRNHADLARCSLAAQRWRFEDSSVHRWRYAYLSAIGEWCNSCLQVLDNVSIILQRRVYQTHSFLSGNHCVVNVGHSRAVLSIVSSRASAFRGTSLTLGSYRRGRGYSSSTSCTLQRCYQLNVNVLPCGVGIPSLMIFCSVSSSSVSGRATVEPSAYVGLIAGSLSKKSNALSASSLDHLTHLPFPHQQNRAP